MPQCAWRNMAETSPPPCAPQFTWLHLKVFACSLKVLLFKKRKKNVFSIPSSVCFQLQHENEHIISGLVDAAEQVIAHVFYLLLYLIFFSLSFPLCLFVSHFFCCMRISFSLLTLSSDDSASLWSACRPMGHCTACLCVSVGFEHACALKRVYVWHSKSVSCHINHRVAVSAEPAPPRLGKTAVGLDEIYNLFSCFLSGLLTWLIFIIFSFTNSTSSESIQKWVQGLGSNHLISCHPHLTN